MAILWRSNPNYTCQDGLLLNKDRTAILAVPLAETEVTVPKTVKSVSILADNHIRVLRLETDSMEDMPEISREPPSLLRSLSGRPAGCLYSGKSGCFCPRNRKPGGGSLRPGYRLLCGAKRTLYHHRRPGGGAARQQSGSAVLQRHPHRQDRALADAQRIQTIVLHGTAST